MPVLNEQQYLGDLLKHEYEQPDYTRDIVTVLADAVDDKTTLWNGNRQITASGKVTPVTKTAVDGSETAFGVILYDVTCLKLFDTKAVAIVRGPAIVDPNKLIWDASMLVGDQAAALATLKSLGIIAAVTA